MKTPVFIYALAQLLSVPCSATLGKCYYPDGSPSLSDFPCDPNAKNSPCCGGPGTVCLSNGLCQGSGENVIRGSCSDQSWTSPLCANYCLAADSGGTDLISCYNVTNTDTSYCCDHTSYCCDSGVGRFNVLPEKPQRHRKRIYRCPCIFGSTFYKSSIYNFCCKDDEDNINNNINDNSHNDNDERSSRKSKPESVRPAIQGVHRSESRARSSTTSFEEAAAISDLPIDSSPSQSDQSSGLSTGAKAGVGVGAGVGAILVATIAFLLWKLRQNENQRNIAPQNDFTPPPNPPMQEFVASAHPP
ncbi:hypothetical protein Trco_007116, partial [Trichoderma cornu-damae]